MQDSSLFENSINVHRKVTNYNTVIVHSTPNMWNTLLQDVNLSNKTIIGRTVWEFEKLMPSWVDAINHSKVNTVSVPTEWNKTTFERSGVTKPIIVEPHINVMFPYTKVDLKKLIEDKGEVLYNGDFSQFDLQSAYKFYTIGQFISRKGIAETIEAFCLSFTRNSNAILFVKAFGRDYSEEEKNECKKKIKEIIASKNTPPIVFLKDIFNYDEIQSLHEQCDCYVQLTRSEGFGLGIFEAYNRGKKVIVTNHGGHVEFLPNKYEGLVDCELVSVKDSIFYNLDLDETYLWAKPSIKHAVQLLKKMINETKIYTIGQMYNNEEYSAKQYVKWFGSRFIFKTSNPIKRLRLYYRMINDDKKIQINDKVFSNLPTDGYVEVHFTDDCTHINCQCPTFNPLKKGCSSDDRDLGILLNSIEYTDENGIEYAYPINMVSTLNDEIAKILNVKYTESNVYYHCGDFGDIIYSLPIIKHTGGGTLYLGNDILAEEERCLPREMISYQKFEFMKSLLESQSYIKEVIFTEKYPQNVTHDLNKFRRLFIKTKNEYDDFPNGANINLLDAALSSFDIDLSVQNNKWLTIQNKKIINKKIVINRTERVRNNIGESDDAYKFIITNHPNDTVFVGTDTEYNQFVQQYGHVERYVVKNAEELTQLIDQCYLFVGNSSFPFALSEALKKHSYFEIRDDYFRHTKFVRDGNHFLNISSVSKIKIPKIYHVVPLYEPKDAETQYRLDVAKESWNEVYRVNDNIIPIHVYERDYPRTTETLGDKRKCPFLKDIIKIAYDKCLNDDDIVLVTNDDTILSPFIGAKIYEKILRYQACKSFRINISQYNGFDDTNIYNVIGKDGGRDMFAFTKRWIKRNIELIPDYALGATDWDFYLAILIQYTNGIWISKTKNDNTCVTDIELGHVFHIYHDPPWRLINNVNNYNSQLTKSAIERLGFNKNFKDMNYDKYQLR